MVATLDALVCGVHFPEDTPAADVAFKSLAVNLSDLAAMGADVVAAQASCEAPAEHAAWREAVAAELHAEAAHALCVAASVALLDAPERRVCVQALGRVPDGLALTRDGARPGDRVWVSGTLGDAGAGLAIVQGRLDAGRGAHRDHLLERLARPRPRVALGRQLRGVASAAIDVSDGIAGDAAHLSRRSGVRVRLEVDRLPLSAALREVAGETLARRLAVFAGDDYELLFTAPPAADAAVARAAREGGVPVRRIGEVLSGTGCVLEDAAGRRLEGAAFEHFRRHPAP
jgi:thiamine-monophosphate kinase